MSGTRDNARSSKQTCEPRDNFQTPIRKQREKKNRTEPQRERFDTQDLRRRFAESKTNMHAATARALRLAQPQRVRRAQATFARRRSESASTRAISAEGSPRARQVRTEPQRERFDTHDLRTGFIFVSQRLQVSETLRLPKFTDLVSAAATRPIASVHQRKTYCALHEKPTGVSHNAALAMEFCGNTQIRRSARRHGESASTRAMSAEGSPRARLRT